MTKPFSEDQKQEWSAVYRQTLVLAEFMERHVPEFAESIRRADEPRRPFSSSLSGLKEARRDLLEMVADLPGTELRELDAQLGQKLGTSLDALQGKRLTKLAALREKGVLTTDSQFRLVYGRVEQIWEDPASLEEVTELNALLASYEEKAALRRERKNTKKGSI